ncbi:MAG: YabP/YqfC family sporulation protein [Gemmiger sp.]
MPDRTSDTARDPTPAAVREHTLILRSRQQLTMTGVTRVISCDENGAVLETPLGNLTVGGQEIQVSELSVQSGQVSIAGKIEFLQYAENRQSSGGLLARLLR